MKTFTAYLKLLRPEQWLKNLILFFPPFLGGTILLPGILGRGTVSMLAFCFVSSSMYVLNDVLDAKQDAVHPQKRRRAVASGMVGKGEALLLAASLAVCGVAAGLAVSRHFCLLVVAYLAIVSLYSLYFKRVPIMDIFCISSVFLLRLEAGGSAFDVVISEWLYLNVFFLSLFLSTGKRLGEKSTLGDDAGAHRQSLMSYPAGFLDGLLFMTGTAALITYTMYTIKRFPLALTVPLCTFGLFRYIMRVKSGAGGDPTDSLLKDTPLLCVGILWVLLVGWSIYR